MELLAQTGARGVLLAANATTLSQALDDSQTNLDLADAVFSDADVVTIGEEDITLGGDQGDQKDFDSCTRGANSTTPAAHALGQPVRDADGTEILSVTGDGSKTLKGIRVESPNCEITVAIEVDGTIKLIGATSPYAMTWFYPMPNYEIPDGTVIKILAWLDAGAVDETVVSAVFMGA